MGFLLHGGRQNRRGAFTGGDVQIEQGVFTDHAICLQAIAFLKADDLLTEIFASFCIGK